jgi:hypothetical protein
MSHLLVEVILEEKTKITNDSRPNILTTDFVPIDAICTSSVILITTCYGLYSHYITINGYTFRPKTAL